MLPKKLIPLAAVFCSLFFLNSCSKNAEPAQSVTSNLNDDVSFAKDGNETKLTLRPGPDDGQDVYVDKKEGVRSTNNNDVPELNSVVWAFGDTIVRSSTFIRFDELSQIPTTARVTSAKLYLYGLPSSISVPQGDSGDNACYINRVTGPWDEATLKYGNRPETTTNGQSSFPATSSQWNADVVADVTDMVKYFVRNPSENFGFNILLQNGKNPYKSIVFGSSEQTDKNLRPKLIVKYK